jgi:hypothetical protein
MHRPALMLRQLLLLLPLLGAIGADTQPPAPPKVVITKAQADSLFKGKRALMVMQFQPNKKISYRSATEGDEIVDTTVPLYLVDLTASPAPTCVLLTPSAKAIAGDPFISPDGTRVTYHNGKGIQVARLAAGVPEATLIAAEGYDPRWWVHPTTGDEYIIYVDTRPLSQHLEGKTFMRKLRRGTCVPEGEATVLLDKLAFRNGRSPDGSTMCTTQPGHAMVQLDPPDAVENAKTKMLFSGGGRCNGSISQDPKRPRHYLWEDPSHVVIYYDPMQKEDEARAAAGGAKILPPADYKHQQWCEWSTHPDFFTCAPCVPDDFADHKLHDAHIYQWSTGTWTKVTEGTGATHLWVER